MFGEGEACVGGIIGCIRFGDFGAFGRLVGFVGNDWTGGPEL